MADTYQVGKDYTGVLEKKSTFGWSKKHVLLNGLNFSVHDSEGSPSIFSTTLGNITRGEGGDPLTLGLFGNNEVVLRAENRQQADHWFDLIWKALEVAGKVKPRLGGLPTRDPRHGLKYLEIPPEYIGKFQTLARAVIYWFSPIKKYGSKSRLTGKFSTEDRIGFISDKAFYVTKPSSEVTRCIRFDLLGSIFTNYEVKEQAEETFVVFKMKSPDYDFYFANPDASTVVTCISTLYKYLNKGLDLKVTQVKKPDDPSVQLQLNRPEDYAPPAVILPVNREDLKAALDKYMAARGLKMGDGGSAKPAVKHADPGAAAKGGNAPTTSAPAKQEPADPLQRFLKGISLDKHFDKLSKQGVDLEVLECMDDDDMGSFGIKSKEEVSLIREKMQDVEFMSKVKSKSAEVPTVTSSAPPPASTSATTPGTSASNAGSAPKPAINLDEDDDDFGILASSPSGTQTKKSPIIIDDDFDDFDIKPASSEGQTKMAINLDTDSDLDIAPAPKPSAQAILDDDDI